MIPIPDSVKFYWGDAINRAAINVLGGSTEVPTDLTLPEMERFELANLAARRVRVEYWRLLRTLWSASWGESVRTGLLDARLLSYGEHKAFTQQTDELADPSIETAWTTHATAGVFDLPGRGQLFTRLAFIEKESEVLLQFYLAEGRENFAISDGLDLGMHWGDDGYSRRQTRLSLPPLMRDGIIDNAPLTSASRECIKALVLVVS